MFLCSLLLFQSLNKSLYTDLEKFSNSISKRNNAKKSKEKKARENKEHDNNNKKCISY